jgi:organic hydroperoxide reductase OsmC/OhrA
LAGWLSTTPRQWRFRRATRSCCESGEIEHAVAGFARLAKGGLIVTPSASVLDHRDLIIALAAHVDPEEAFVASLSSCHMLTFLAIACKQKFVLDSYEDEAVGHLEKNADGELAITRVELRPKITWGDDRKPSAEELDKIHHAAHESCFIANSVKTEVRVTKI